MRARTIGECHLCVVCIELDEMEFGLVDMNVSTAMVANWDYIEAV